MPAKVLVCGSPKYEGEINYAIVCMEMDGYQIVMPHPETAELPEWLAKIRVDIATFILVIGDEIDARTQMHIDHAIATHKTILRTYKRR